MHRSTEQFNFVSQQCPRLGITSKITTTLGLQMLYLSMGYLHSLLDFFMGYLHPHFDFFMGYLHPLLDFFMGYLHPLLDFFYGVSSPPS